MISNYSHHYLTKNNSLIKFRNWNLNAARLEKEKKIRQFESLNSVFSLFESFFFLFYWIFIPNKITEWNEGNKSVNSIETRFEQIESRRIARGTSELACRVSVPNLSVRNHRKWGRQTDFLAATTTRENARNICRAVSHLTPAHIFTEKTSVSSCFRGKSRRHAEKTRWKVCPTMLSRVSRRFV